MKNQKTNFKLAKAAGLMALGVVALTGLQAKANLVQDGGFEDPQIGGYYSTLYSPNDTIGGVWKITAGSVDLIHSYWNPSEPNQSVDMAGISKGTIEQTITGLHSGWQYSLSFDLAGNPDGSQKIKTLDVSLNGSTPQVFTFDATGKSLSNMGWESHTIKFTASSSTLLLAFSDDSAASSGDYPYAFGAALDNVDLVAVPEASTLIAGALLLLPFGAGAIRSLRKNAVA